MIIENSVSFPFLWDEIKIPIKFGSDYEMTKSLLEKAASHVVRDYPDKAQVEWDRMVKKYILENQNINSVVTIEATDNWIEYTLRYVVDYKKRRTIKNDLFIMILDEIDKTDGAINLASETIEIKERTNLNKD